MVSNKTAYYDFSSYFTKQGLSAWLRNKSCKRLRSRPKRSITLSIIPRLLLLIFSWWTLISHHKADKRSTGFADRSHVFSLRKVVNYRSLGSAGTGRLWAILIEWQTAGNKSLCFKLGCGVGVGFLRTLGVGVGVRFFSPTPEVQQNHFYIALKSSKS